MTAQEQILEIAQLDGWKFCPATEGTEEHWIDKHGGWYTRCTSNYLYSFNALHPVITKTLNRHTCHAFFDALGLIAIKDWQDVDGAPHYEGDGSYFELWVLFKASPAQQAEALLRAIGKWKGEEIT